MWLNNFSKLFLTYVLFLKAFERIALFPVAFLLQTIHQHAESNSLSFYFSVLWNKGWQRSAALFLWPWKWRGKVQATAWRLRSTSGLLLGALKYSWYKYCKAPYLIKVPCRFNEVTEGSIDQAFCFMPWRFLFFPHVSLSITWDDLLFNTHPQTLSQPFLFPL